MSPTTWRPPFGLWSRKSKRRFHQGGMRSLSETSWKRPVKAKHAKAVFHSKESIDEPFFSPSSQEMEKPQKSATGHQTRKTTEGTRELVALRQQREDCHDLRHHVSEAVPPTIVWMESSSHHVCSSLACQTSNIKTG